MNILLIIFLGGGTGATFRYLISELVNKLIPTSIGYGTISVNLIGAFLIKYSYLSLKTSHYTKMITWIQSIFFYIAY